MAPKDGDRAPQVERLEKRVSDRHVRDLRAPSIRVEMARLPRRPWGSPPAVREWSAAGSSFSRDSHTREGLGSNLGGGTASSLWEGTSFGCEPSSLFWSGVDSGASITLSRLRKIIQVETLFFHPSADSLYNLSGACGFLLILTLGVQIDQHNH
jgi:hypothetical protein